MRLNDNNDTLNSSSARIARKRHWRVRWFIVGLILHLLWWDGICKLPPLSAIRPAPRLRWQRLAQRYRQLAHEEGGLLIKIGQFLSLRIDLLPQVVLDELSLLQDQVPAISWAIIRPHIESDLGGSVDQLFAWVSPEAVASASIAQVHTAQLKSGEPVVIKVVRPGVPERFARDLQTFAAQSRMFNLMPAFRRTFDLSKLLAEFTRVTNLELDLAAEGRYAERFAANFADDATIYVPAIYRQYSGAYTLTMENVNYISLRNVAAIQAVGIDRKQVAQRLAESIAKQIFVHHFVHADPHPGNVFVKPLPLPHEGRSNFAPGEPVPFAPNRSFQIAFIDFGMAVEIPPTSQTWLREFIIGLGLRDAHRIILAYQEGGLLQPGVDIDKVEAMTVDLLNGFQDMLVGIAPDPEAEETKIFHEKHSDLMGNNFPFKIPMELLFMYRALGTVSLVVKKLDPNFELSTAVAPMAVQLLFREWQQDTQERIQAVLTLLQLLLTHPVRVDQVLMQAQRAFQAPEPLQQLFIPLRGGLKTRTEMDSKDREALQQLENAIRRLNRTLVTLGIVAVGIVLYLNVPRTEIWTLLENTANRYSIFFMCLSFVLVVWNIVRGGS